MLMKLKSRYVRENRHNQNLLIFRRAKKINQLPARLIKEKCKKTHY